MILDPIDSTALRTAIGVLTAYPLNDAGEGIAELIGELDEDELRATIIALGGIGSDLARMLAEGMGIDVSEITAIYGETLVEIETEA